MAGKEERDRYAQELTRRFEEFTRWAIAHWPDKHLPLLESDFTESRREIAQIVGPKLGDGESNEDEPTRAASDNTAPGIPVDAKQYVDVTPAPWP
ncbi:MAG TPA: hypothetical protein VF450_15725 [Noviherbaspirillum sp.]